MILDVTNAVKLDQQDEFKQFRKEFIIQVYHILDSIKNNQDYSKKT